MKRFLIVFMCVIYLFFNVTSTTVYATSHGGGGGTHLSGFDSWSNAEKAKYWYDRLLASLGASCGLVFNPSNWNYDAFMQYFNNAAQDQFEANNCASYEEWVAMQMTYTEDETTGEPGVLMSDALMDAMYLACMKYVNEYTGWMNLWSYDVKQLASTFGNNAIYQKLLSKVKAKANNQILMAGVTMSNGEMFLHFFTLDYDGLIVDTSSYDSKYNSYLVYSQDTWMGYDYYFTSAGNWVDGDGSYESYKYQTVSWHCQSKVYMSAGYFQMHTGTPVNPNFGTTSSRFFLLDDGMREYRAYKTLEDYKAYSVGSRPYFVTDKFKNYDVSGDNSCILTESELNGSSVYGDVVNYITNNYGDTANGLTEDELIAIVTAIIQAMQENNNNNGGSSGGGSVSGNGIGSGTGFTGFLDGIGGLFDGVLAILGKVLEYIGKVLTLLTDTVSDIITVIPENVTNLLSALFPFIPEEWVTAITLGIVGTVILGLVRMFKS